MALTPIRVPTPFRRVMAKKTAQMQDAVASCVLQLRKDWQYPGLHSHRVQGTKDLWECYVDQRNRVTFYWDGPTIVLENNCPHKIVG